MNKFISTGMAMAMCLTIFGGTADAYSYSFDELSYNSSSPALERTRQNNYIDALRLRYKHMYNRVRHNRDYYNSFLQKDRLEEVKRENNISRNLGSDMNRDGEMEQDKDRIQPRTKNRVQAVNAKQTFRKAAIDYYLDGGTGYSNAAAMEMGNIDGMTNQVPRRKMVDAMYKMQIGATNLSTRDMVRNLGTQSGNTGVTKRNTYYKGRFHDRMLSPVMSTRWMD